MSDNRDAPDWVIPLMRLGYSARGVTYLIIGALAFLAAWTGGQAEGTSDALSTLKQHPLGLVALWVIAIGMFAYAIWRFICAWYDLEQRGTDAKAIIARIGQTVTGLIHLGIGVSVGRMAMGSGSSGGNGESGAQSVTSWLMTLPYGTYIVMAVGVITIGAGVYYGYKGIAEKYKNHLMRTEWSEKLDPLVKAGLVAHGIIIVMIGVFLIYAGINTDPGQAGGIGKAFQTVRSQPYGMFLLGALGLGTIAFAVYCFVEAVYRVVPQLAGPDMQTLASEAKGKARRAAASV